MTHARPWHRSLLFWLGLPALLFLIWSWFIPRDMWILSGGTPHHHYRLEYHPGAIRASHMWIDRKLSPNETFDRPYTTSQRWKAPVGPDSNSFTRRLRHPFALRFARQSSFENHRLTTYLTLPFWLLVPLYLTTWLTTLALWQRRRHRLAKATTTPSP